MSNSPPLLRACPNCGHSHPPLTILQPRGLRVAQCPACRVAYLASWTPEFDADLYAYYRRRIGLPRDQVYSALNRPRLAEILHRLTQAPARTLLDVGCGAGHWVHYAAEHGWNALGLDLSPEAVELAQSLGAHVRQVDFFAPEFDGSRFGAVTMWELLEHVPQPARFIERAAELLHEDGILAVSTPNFDSVGRRWLAENWMAFDPQHLFYFTPQTLRALLLRRFKTVHIETRGITVSARDASPQEQRTRQQSARRRVASSRSRRLAKALADNVLRRVHVGETLVAWAYDPK